MDFEEETADALPLLITRMDVFLIEFLRDFPSILKTKSQNMWKKTGNNRFLFFRKRSFVKWTYTKEQSGDSEMVRIKPDYDVLPNYFHGRKGKILRLPKNVLSFEERLPRVSILILFRKKSVQNSVHRVTKTMKRSDIVLLVMFLNEPK